MRADGNRRQNIYVKIRLDRLNDDGGGTTTTVADTGSANLAALLAEDAEQGGDDASAGAAERVAKGDGTAVKVDLVLGDAANLHVRKSDDGEGLVDLESIDSAELNTGVLEGLGHGERGGSGELGGAVSGIAPAHDLANGLQTVLLDGLLGGKDDGGGAVREGRGVGSSDSAGAGDEDGPQSLGLGLVEVLGLVVLVDNDVGLAPAAADLNGGNLLLEPAVGLGGLGLLVRANAVVILVLAGEAVLGGALLSLDTHVLRLVHVGKAVLQDTVDELLVTELGAGAQGREVVRDVGHGLGATGDNDLGVASDDGLGTENDGLQGRSADLVDGGSDGCLRKAGAEGALAGRVLAKAGDCQRKLQAEGRCLVAYLAERTLPKKTSSTSSLLMPARSTEATECVSLKGQLM